MNCLGFDQCEGRFVHARETIPISAPAITDPLQPPSFYGRPTWPGPLRLWRELLRLRVELRLSVSIYARKVTVPAISPGIPSMINTLIGVLTLVFAWAIYHQLSLLVRLTSALRADVAKLLPPSHQDDEDGEGEDNWGVPIFGGAKNMGELSAAYRSAQSPRTWRFEARPEK